MGQEIDVLVEDVDPNGKISLKPAGDAPRREGGRDEKPAAKPDEVPADEVGSDEVSDDGAEADEVPADEAGSDEVSDDGAEADEVPADEAGSDDSNGSDSGEVIEASFEDAFASELEAVHGELGNAAPARRGGGRRRGR